MRVPVSLIKRVSRRLRRTVHWGRLERMLARGRGVGRGRLAPAVVRGLALVVARPARAAASTRLVRVARARLGRTRVARARLGRTRAVGVLAGGGAAVALGVFSSLVGTGDRSRAAGDRPALVVRAASAAMSPTRFELNAGVAQPRWPSRSGRAYYRRTASRHVPASAETGFLALYREAAHSFGVSWQLIASIHRQETAFSTVAGTYHGLNAFGCCAGPMQFNVSNGAVSTWDLYRDSFRRGGRPHRYPHRTRRHPSVYDDFDAIMAAGALLRDSGATDLLDGGAWSAAYAYYGHDRFGVGYASQVVARAQGWELNGFCVNCPEDSALISVLDDLYGVDARRQLRDEEQRRKHKKHKPHKKHHDGEASRQAAENNAGHDDTPRPSASEEDPEATPEPDAATTNPAPTTTTETPSTTTTPAAPAPPAAKRCTPVARLLGCRP